jgi:DNA-binding NarL/FixJ family response regulator
MSRITLADAVTHPAVGRGNRRPTTDRERDVLASVAQGLTNAGVARRLVVSERTVEAHLRAVFLKLGISDNGDDHRRVRAVITFLAG